MRDEDFLKQFYADYIRLLQREATAPYADILQHVEQSLAPEFLTSIRRSLPDLDADPILVAQDFSEAWAVQVSVSANPAGNEPSRYLVCFGVPGTMRHALVTSLTRQGKHLLLNAPRLAHPSACPR